LKNTQISNFTKIRAVGAELFHTDGRTDRHEEANSRFAQFCDRTEGVRKTVAVQAETMDRKKAAAVQAETVDRMKTVAVQTETMDRRKAAAV
jgi:hypothetical protein